MVWSTVGVAMAATTSTGASAPAADRLTSDERREALLDVAQALVAERGAAHVTMGTVASRADVTRALVYKHFGNRSDILAALYRREARKLDRALRRLVEAAPEGFEPKLRAFIRGLLGAVDTHASVIVPLRPFGAGPTSRKDRRQRDRQTVGYFSQLASSEFELTDEVARPAISILFAGIDSLLAQAAARRPSADRAVLEELYVQLTMNALAGLGAQPPKPAPGRHDPVVSGP